MAYTYTELKRKKVTELREIASGLEHEAVQGYTQLNKEHLLDALCTALNLDKFEHHRAVGIDKVSIKGRIKELKKQRDEIMGTRDKAALKRVRQHIRSLKKKLRRAAV